MVRGSSAQTLLVHWAGMSEAQAYEIPKACGGPRFTILTLVLALMVAAAVFALVSERTHWLGTLKRLL